MAAEIGKDYIVGQVDRQEYLETSIKWISDGKVETYMLDHQHDPNANELRLYFENVISWL